MNISEIGFKTLLMNLSEYSVPGDAKFICRDKGDMGL